MLEDTPREYCAQSEDEIVSVLHCPHGCVNINECHEEGTSTARAVFAPCPRQRCLSPLSLSHPPLSLSFVPPPDCIELRNASTCTPRATGKSYDAVLPRVHVFLCWWCSLTSMPILALRALNILLGLAEQSTVLQFLSVSGPSQATAPRCGTVPAAHRNGVFLKQHPQWIADGLLRRSAFTPGLSEDEQNTVVRCVGAGSGLCCPCERRSTCRRGQPIRGADLCDL